MFSLRSNKSDSTSPTREEVFSDKTIKSWILSKICDRLVEQGPNHKGLITQYYKIMAKEARKEFREDNKLFLDSFLRECFEKSLE